MCGFSLIVVSGAPLPCGVKASLQHHVLWALQKGVGSHDTRMGSSQTRVPCTGRPILNPWTSKEAPHTLRTTVLEASESHVQRDGASQLGRPASAAGTRPRFCCETAKCIAPGIPSQQTSSSLLRPGLVGWLVLEGFFLYLRVCFSAQSEMDENQIQMAGDDVDLPEDLRKMVDEDQEEEEDKDSILGQLQNLQNMDLDAIKEKAQATFSEIKQTAEQKCAVM